MAILFDSGGPAFDAVLHPTDLSEASLSAFHHALAIGIRHGAHFTLLHAIGRRSTDSWPGFPSVRDTLARWRAAGHTADVEDRIRRSSVSKVEVAIRDPVAASMDHITRNAVDLIVLATEDRRGLSRLVRAGRAERLARTSKVTTLFLPAGARRFVSAETGRVSLSRILIPVSPLTDPRPSMLFAVRKAALLDDPSLEITLLNVGEGEESTPMEVPQLPYCQWKVMRRSGDVVDQILGVADEIEADAIVMSTAWQKGSARGVVGNVTERVLHRSPCPLAAIPVESRS